MIGLVLAGAIGGTGAKAHLAEGGREDVALGIPSECSSTAGNARRGARGKGQPPKPLSRTMATRRNPTPTVLYVEDSQDDFLLLKLASRRCGTPFSLQHAEDGEKAIDYLNGVGAYADREEHPFPNLVLLDLKMPRLDGFEVLEWIRANPDTKSLPVVVLAGSAFRADVRRALEFGANSYATKPANFNELEVLVDQIASVWLARESAYVKP
jgi:CheY-like chemotaxis protein